MIALTAKGVRRYLKTMIDRRRSVLATAVEDSIQYDAASSELNLLQRVYTDLFGEPYRGKKSVVVKQP
jgi:hypothetical protein